MINGEVQKETNNKLLNMSQQLEVKIGNTVKFRVIDTYH